MSASTPRIAIIIPLYGHSSLLWEALETALDQTAEGGYGIVIVNDGCKFEASHIAALAATRASETIPIVYAAQPNGGLSAARNTGISVALESWPEIEAVYLLDADNRLTETSVAAMLRALDEDPEADWFYPDIRTVGLREDWEIEGPYSRQIHLERNICEAGSLVRRRILDAGVRFDESMRKGYEDWEFWLAAQSAGFTNGRHLPGIEFRYRRRPESMLTDSERSDGEIRRYLLSKHPWMATLPPDEGELSRGEAPFLLLTEAGARYAQSMVHMSDLIPVEQAVDDYWRWRLRPGAFGFPKRIICVSEAMLAALRDAKLAEWALFDVYARLKPGAASTLSLDLGKPECFDISNPAWSYCPEQGLHMLMLDQPDFARLLESGAAGLTRLGMDGAASAGLHLALSARVLWVPKDHCDPVPPQALSILMQFVVTVSGRPYPMEEGRQWQYLRSSIEDRGGRHRSLLAPSQMPPARYLPDRSSGRPQVAFVVPIAEFGGVERVAYHVAGVLKAAGYDVHLVCILTPEIHVPREYRENFASFAFFGYEGLNAWENGPYLTTSFGNRLPEYMKDRLLGLLSGMDVVINCQSVDIPGVVADLRRGGTLCLDYQHVVEQKESGLPLGHPFVGLAFEHAFAATLCCSVGLEEWFAYNGVPREKLIAIPNGPGISASPAQIDAAEAMRAERYAGGVPEKLRVLYVGRMDAQKGLDRLIDLISATKDRDDVEWRVVGKAIVQSGDDAVPEDFGITVRPPMYSSDDIRKLLEWADVMVLPSRYEGLPLVIIDAMCSGLPTLATDVGAVREVIDGVNGLVMEPDRYVADTLAAFDDLLTRDGALAAMSKAACDTARARNWQDAAQPLVDFLNEKLSNKAKPVTSKPAQRQLLLSGVSDA